MANSTVSTNNEVIKFTNKVNREYVREGKFGPYIGDDQNKIIQTRYDLKKMSIPLISKLSGDGVEGSQTLVGNEQALSNYEYKLTPTYKRQGTLIDNEENEKSEFELLQEARPALMNWAMELKRDEIIQGFGAVEAGQTYYNYGDASAVNLDTWNTNNQDRILYGAAKSNLTAGDHTASLANIDTTNDKLTAGRLTLLKRMAMSASPLIRPVIVKGDEPWFVLFVDQFGFRDLNEDSTIKQAQREAWSRGKDNPLFTGGDLLYNGVIVKEVPDIGKFIDGDGTGTKFDGVWGANSTADSLATAGNGNTRVGMGFFCGAQALGFGIGRLPSIKKRKEDDYEHQNGVGIALKHDIRKTFYNNKQHGMITHFYSAVADS